MTRQEFIKKHLPDTAQKIQFEWISDFYELLRCERLKASEEYSKMIDEVFLKNKK